MNFIFYIIILIFFVIVILSIYLLKSFLFNKLKTEEHLANYNRNTFGIEWENKINNWYNSTTKINFYIQSNFGYKLSCYEIKNNSKKYAIILHGVTTNKEFIKKYAYLYNELGYSIIAIDHRYHGLSGGKNITYGYYEKYDLQNLVKYIKEKEGNDTIIGIHGESMGSGILLAYASMVEDICDFYVADCPYSNFYNLVLVKIKETIKTPLIINKLIINFTNFFSKLFFKFDMKDIDILGNIKNIKKPILFLNAKNDEYIPIYMTKQLYDNSSGNNKEIFWFNTGAHAGAFNHNPEKYIDVVKTFIGKHVDN